MTDWNKLLAKYPALRYHVSASSVERHKARDEAIATYGQQDVDCGKTWMHTRNELEQLLAEVKAGDVK